MNPTDEMPIRHTIGQKREASWNRGVEKGKKVMIKFLKLYIEDPRKANEYFTKKTVTSNERATKSYFEFLTMELVHVFKEFAAASMRHNFDRETWLTQYISWYYENGGYS